MDVKNPNIFDKYLRQDNQSVAENAEQWQTAIGLQAVDGLKPSKYLLDIAQKNIEGEISIDEVQKLLHSYYESKSKRIPDDDDTEEADKVSANIKKVLSTKTLAFNANGFVSVHRRIFEGVLKHAGEIRTYDITKKEFVLRGDTVHYLNWEDLHRALDYDIQKEKDFSYKGLSAEEKVNHICRFVSGLWQIHPFEEGNTRTTAVFVIQYLRSIGYNVNNEMFANHSWYFRNALVRANYKNSNLGIDYDFSFLEKFFHNLLLGTTTELKNRYMVINPPNGWKAEKQKNETVNSQNETVNETVNLTKKEQQVLSHISQHPQCNYVDIANNCSMSRATVGRIVKSLREKNHISHVGSDKTGFWEIKK